MKKLILSLVMVLVLGGCSWGSSEREDPVGENSEEGEALYVFSSEGVLRSEGYGAGKGYTHSLENEEEETVIFLRSKGLNLSKFNDESVKVKGMVYSLGDGGEVLEVENIEKIMVGEPTDFEDEDFGFKFVYLSNFEVEKKNEGVVLVSEDGIDHIYITQTEPEKVDLDEIVGGISLRGRRISEEEMEVAGLPAIRRVEEVDGRRVITVFLRGGENFYTLHFTNPEMEEEGDEDENKKIFFEVVESFEVEDDDLSELEEILMGVCGTPEKVACEEGEVCLLPRAYAQSKGECVSEEEYVEEEEEIKNKCGVTRGFVKKAEVECENEEGEFDCRALPSCECPSPLVWDKEKGCVPEGVASVEEEEEVLTEDEEEGEEGDDEEDEESEVEISGEATADWEELTTGPEVVGEKRRMYTETFNFGLYYPKNWYYAGDGKTYYFAPTEEVQGEETAVTVKVVSSCADGEAICVKRGGEVFEVKGMEGYENEARGMAESLVVK